MIPKLNEHNHIFPNPAYAGKEGLVAWGGDLSAGRILSAYERGIFPWFNPSDPILWWSPDPRLLLFPDAIKVSASLRKSMRHFEITYDKDFESVIRLCRDTRIQKGENSWIFDAIIEAYISLHIDGFAHSVECYCEGELVGGLYGLYLGGVFCGESMFSQKRDASKAALVGLCQKVKELEGDFIDCQIPTAHLKSMGAVEIKRDLFLVMLKKALEKPMHHEWVK
ncbi:MAG: leucyl/phenylalanyl-tRNA--protein transferase [Sulfurospirillaceae bacterium]|nr:leucyl/phenylalanyl-tRNA--protein transferase [Sulfurospirillaceae bacterium]